MEADIRARGRGRGRSRGRGRGRGHPPKALSQSARGRECGRGKPRGGLRRSDGISQPTFTQERATHIQSTVMQGEALYEVQIQVAEQVQITCHEISPSPNSPNV